MWIVRVRIFLLLENRFLNFLLFSVVIEIGIFWIDWVCFCVVMVICLSEVFFFFVVVVFCVRIEELNVVLMVNVSVVILCVFMFLLRWF